MPAPGDQYNGIPNPFNEPATRVSAYTAREIATLQSRLSKQLGPEYISTRPGGTGKVAYLAAEKVINLANEVFGFNGWSSSIQNTTIDYVEENQSTGRISLGISIIVRVTLKDGTFHEDIGYGQIENAKGKAAAFEKAKKEAATDALKRALRTFGNILGNCLYDKDYLSKIGKMKVTPAKWDTSKLHRHPDYAPVQQPPAPTDLRDMQNEIKVPQLLPTESTVTEGDDEFGSNLFDGVDLSEAHGDEVTMVEDNMNPSNAPISNVHGKQSLQRVQSVPNIRTSDSAHNGGRQGTPQGQPYQPPPQLKHQRPTANAYPQDRTIGPAQVSHAQPNNKPNTGQRIPTNEMQPPQRPQSNPRLNQAPRNESSHQLNNNKPGPAASNADLQNAPQPDNSAEGVHPPPVVGFVTGRAAELLQKANLDPNVSVNAPTFNPHAESPSIRRTSGVDHRRSTPIRREALPGNSGDSSSNMTAMAGANRTNFINPQSDTNRRIGMPGNTGAQSPLANRGAYKPPAMVQGVKRGTEGIGRPPLADLSNFAENGGDGLDTKKIKINGGATPPL